MVLIAPVPGHCLPFTFQDFSMPFRMYVHIHHHIINVYQTNVPLESSKHSEGKNTRF